jgi:AcrR family transcriptional regulator
MTGSRGRGRPRTFDRDAVLDAALEQFWLKGFESTSITDLTAASGCTAPTLYALFGSKESLYEEAVKRYAAQAFGPRTELLTSGPADRDVLAALLAATIEASTSSSHPHGCLILTGGLADAQSPSSSVVAGLRTFILEGFRRFLLRAQGAGTLGPCDVDALARFYLGVAQGIAAQAVDGANSEQLTPIIEMALKAWPTN